jgi:hypothetical protein
MGGNNDCTISWEVLTRVIKHILSFQDVELTLLSIYLVPEVGKTERIGRFLGFKSFFS